MSENTNIGLTVEAWAKIVIERWEKKIVALKINRTGKLLSSLSQTIITQANGDPVKIIFAFEYYGKFVDMGTGRGVKINQVENSNRRKRQWYSKVFFSQVKQLSVIMAEKYAQKGQATIITEIQKS